MIYIVKRIDEDLDFGCEERAEGAPVMAVVTLMNSSDEELIVKSEDAMLYERNINEGDKVYFDEENNLEKIQDRLQQPMDQLNLVDVPVLLQVSK